MCVVCVRARIDRELGILHMHLVHIISLRTHDSFKCVPYIYTHPRVEVDFEVALVHNITRVSERERERKKERGKRDLGAEFECRVVGVHNEDRDSDRERE